MSSISSISGISSAVSPYLTDLASVMQGNFGQTIKDFQAIGSALKSGNLTTAQTALTALQKDFPASLQSVSAQPFGPNSPANADLQNLTSALKTGDLTGAQKAFTSLETHLKAVANGGSTTTASTGSGFSGTLNEILSGFGITPI
jgi:hypothetical protein